MGRADLMDAGEEESEGRSGGDIGWGGAAGLRGDDTLTVDEAESEDELEESGGGRGEVFEDGEAFEREGIMAGAAGGD